MDDISGFSDVGPFHLFWRIPLHRLRTKRLLSAVVFQGQQSKFKSAFNHGSDRYTPVPSCIIARNNGVTKHSTS